MTQIEQNLERLMRLSNQKTSASAFVSVGIARNIDRKKRTCNIELNENITLYRCRLNSVIDNYDNHLLILPKEGSMVAFEAIDGQLTDTLVLAYSEIEAIEIKISSTSVKIDAAGIVFNEGEDGAVNLNELKDNLNTLKSYCEGLKSAVASGLNGVGAGSAASGSLGATAFNSAMSRKTISFKNMEDTKVKH